MGINTIDYMLKSAGYMTDVDEKGNVQVYDPVHSSVSGGKLVVSEYKLVTIKTLKQYYKFINARS